MEHVLDLYAEPYQPVFPGICFDEVPYQMVSCNLFMFLQPLAGWRQVKVTDQRTIQDFAGTMQDLVEIHFSEAEKIRMVLDNLYTHLPAA